MLSIVSRKRVPRTIFCDIILLQFFVVIFLGASIDGKSDLDKSKPHLLGKGLYCKDPDTGDYHPVNSTWSSNTFCGNYACNIKLKKNTTDFREEIITAESENENKEVIGEESRNKEVIHNKETLSKEVVEENVEEILGLSGNSTNAENVTSIREFLLSIDENELKALFEIYKLAYDMAKEMEQVSELDNPVDEIEKARLAAMVMYNKIPLFQKVPTSESTIPNSNSYQHPYSYYYSHGATDADSSSSASENVPKVVGYKYTNPNEKADKASIPNANPALRVPSYSDAAPQNYLKYYLNPATGQLTPLDSTVSQSPQSTAYVSSNPANNQYSYYYTYPHSHQYPQYTQPQTSQIHTHYIAQSQQPQIGQNQVYYINPNQNQSPQYGQNYNLNPQSNQASGNLNIPLFRKVPEAQTPCAYEQQFVQSQNSIQQNSDALYDKKILDNMAKQYKRALIDPEQLKALQVPLSKEVPLEKRRNLRDLFGGLTKKSRANTMLGKHSKVMHDKAAARSEHIIAKREASKEGRKNLRLKKEKPTSNEEVETYVSIVKCQFESEPGYFRKGKNTDPYPLCCPQKIDEEDEE